MSKVNLARVAEFHNVSGKEYRTTPGIPSKKITDHRISLLDEEVSELEMAVAKRDIVEVLDALVDIQYILHGAVLDFGLQDAFEEAETEVHRSNMSKFCTNTDDARESVNRYGDKDIEAYYKLVDKMFVIRRSIDEKILNGMHFSEPRLKEIIDKIKSSND